MTFTIADPDNCPKPKRNVNKFYIHCSASDVENGNYEGVRLAETIDVWHKARGFDGIGYHYVIDKMGILVTGRSIEQTPAAQAGYNTGTIAVCLHGLAKENFTEEQFDTLRQLADNYDDLYDGKITFHGHCEVSAKLCPVFDYKQVLNLDKKGYITI